MMQFFCGSILAFFAMLALESPTWIGWQTALPAMLWAGIMSLILSLESVFSVISGWLILNEVLSVREGLGCVLMAAAVVLAQLPGNKK